MKISCIAQKMKKAVSLAEKLVFKTHTIASLTGIHIESSDTGVFVSGTNLSAGVKITVLARNELSGNVVVPAVIFSQIIQSFEDNEQILIELEGNQLVISSPRSRITVNTLTASDYPNIPDITGAVSFLYDIDMFHQGLKSVSFAALVSEIKPELSGVYWYQEDKDSVYVATDAFRLAEKRFTLKKEITHPGCLIPLKNIPEMMRIMSEYTGDAEFVLSDHQMSITHKDFYYTTRLVQGNYPNYRMIIPTNHQTIVVIDASEVQKTLRSTQIFHDRFHQVRMVIDPENSQCTFGVAHNDRGEITTHIPARITGPAIEMTIHQKNLQDVLPIINGTHLEISITEPTKPIMITGHDHKDFLYIMMPVSRV